MNLWGRKAAWGQTLLPSPDHRAEPSAAFPEFWHLASSAEMRTARLLLQPHAAKAMRVSALAAQPTPPPCTALVLSRSALQTDASSKSDLTIPACPFQPLTVVAAPVDVYAAAVVARELCQGEAGGVGCGGGRGTVSTATVLPHPEGPPLTARCRFVRAVPAVIIQVTRPRDGDAAPAGAGELVGGAGPGWAGQTDRQIEHHQPAAPRERSPPGTKPPPGPKAPPHGAPHPSRWSWTRPRCSRSRYHHRTASGWGCSGCSCT